MPKLLTKCRDKNCRAPIFYGRLYGGALAPFDVEPNPAGRFIIESEVGDVIQMRALELDQLSVTLSTYIMHFDTCTEKVRVRT